MDELREKIAQGIAPSAWDEENRTPTERIILLSLQQRALETADAALSALKSATGLTDEDLEALMAGRARLLTWDVGEEIVRWHGGPGPNSRDAIDAMWAALRRKTEP